jgi:hypothetical protein
MGLIMRRLGSSVVNDNKSRGPSTWAKRKIKVPLWSDCGRHRSLGVGSRSVGSEGHLAWGQLKCSVKRRGPTVKNP